MSDLYLPVRNRRIHAHLQGSIDHIHNFTMQRLAYHCHLPTADPACDALRYRNIALGGKSRLRLPSRMGRTVPALVFLYLSRDLSRCSFLLLSVMPGGYFKGTTFVFFRYTKHSEISQTRVCCNWSYNRTKVSGYTYVINKWFHELRTFDGQLLYVCAFVIEIMYIHRIILKER
jgi:hypothetical protein